MNNLNQIITKCRLDDPSETAWAVIETIGLPTKFHEMLYPLIRAECIRNNRHATRIAERVGIDGEDAPVDEDNEPTMTRASFLSQNFYDGNKWIMWSKATVEDHERRIAHQSTLIRGLNGDIKRHRWAIEQIKFHNVTCLAEISDLVVA